MPPLMCKKTKSMVFGEKTHNSYVFDRACKQLFFFSFLGFNFNYGVNHLDVTSTSFAKRNAAMFVSVERDNLIISIVIVVFLKCIIIRYCFCENDVQLEPSTPQKNMNGSNCYSSSSFEDVAKTLSTPMDL